MFLILNCRRRLISVIFTSKRSISHISHDTSISHLTPAEKRLYFEHTFAKSHLPPKPVLQDTPRLQFIQPQTYCLKSSNWIFLHNNHDQDYLQRGNVLKVVSWNMHAIGLGGADRASAALSHLKELFGAASNDLIVMLQEITHESLQAVLNCSWVQQNFVVTDTAPPSSIYVDVPGESFILRHLHWKATSYFTLMLIPRRFGKIHCFRAPFATGMGRDALVVDIPISTGGCALQEGFFRLCTTHLESLYGGMTYRTGQLSTISALLREKFTENTKIIAGLVGGDMNAIAASDYELHKTSDVDLKDVWEDSPAPPIPVLKPFQKDITYGRARGNTWGYQSRKSRNRKRLDKFLYTGLVDSVPLTEVEDITGNISRVGIGLQVEVEAWERDETNLELVRGRLVRKTHKEYYPQHWVREISSELSGFRRTRAATWVSDHFGIAAGFRVR